MAFEALFIPLTTWPGPREKNRVRVRFDSTYANTLDLLAEELRRLVARQVVIQSGLSSFDSRNDGWPRSNAKNPEDPGVIVSFASKYGPMSYPCDCFAFWQDNMRAIALSLQALRAVDRYGVARRAEQYRGWKQLPSATPAFSGFVTRAEAAMWLAGVTAVPKDCILEMTASRRSELYRAAARLLPHPYTFGFPEEFLKIGWAKLRLDGADRA